MTNKTGVIRSARKWVHHAELPILDSGLDDYWSTEDSKERKRIRAETTRQLDEIGFKHSPREVREWFNHNKESKTPISKRRCAERMRNAPPAWVSSAVYSPAAVAVIDVDSSAVDSSLPLPSDDGSFCICSDGTDEGSYAGSYEGQWW
jgi:hypothetical protein